MQAETRMTTDAARPLAERIEPMVLELISAHERLIRILEKHRAAISSADARVLGDVVRDEREVLEQIASLDRSCRGVLDEWTGAGPVTVTALAGLLPPPEGPRLAESAAYLRALASRARTLQSTVREASESLSAHINGLMRQVSQRLSHAGTYGPGAKVESRASVVSGLDMSL